LRTLIELNQSAYDLAISEILPLLKAMLEDPDFREPAASCLAKVTNLFS
jgi:hypothetical protein